MAEHCGVFRTEELMQEGIEKIQQFKARYDNIYLDDKESCWNTELIEAMELRSIMVVGEMILTSALNRKESRGAHSREDYTKRDDPNFLKHTLAYYSPAGLDIQYMDVVLDMFEPKERKY